MFGLRTKGLRQRLVRWLLKDVRIPELKVGENTIILREFMDIGEIAEPPPPGAGFTRIYRDSADGGLKRKNPDGTVASLRGLDFYIFSDGSDGDVTITASTTLTRDMSYNNLTVADGVTLRSNGFRIFVKNTLTLGTNAVIDNSGSPGGTPAGGSGAPSGTLGGGGRGGNGGGFIGGGGGGGGGCILIFARTISWGAGSRIVARGGRGGDGGPSGLLGNGLPGDSLPYGIGGAGGGGGVTLESGGGAGGATNTTLRSVVQSSIVAVTWFYGALLGGGGGGGGGAASHAGYSAGGGGGGGGAIVVFYSSSSGTPTLDVGGGAGGTPYDPRFSFPGSSGASGFSLMVKV
jgi:hypothetical protein